MMLLKSTQGIVTGGSSCIGRVTAVRLGAHGASVAVNYYDNDADGAIAAVEARNEADCGSPVQ